jgi:carbonic anhydrase
MEAGDAKILRNAGARVTEDVLRTLVLATHLLSVTRILVMPHTDCKMASGEEHEIHAAILEKSGIDTRGIEIRTVKDQMKALVTDIQRIESYPLLAKNVKVMGAVFNVETGTLTPVI